MSLPELSCVLIPQSFCKGWDYTIMSAAPSQPRAGGNNAARPAAGNSRFLRRDMSVTLQLCRATQCCPQSGGCIYFIRLQQGHRFFSCIVLDIAWQAFQKRTSWLWSDRDTWFTTISCNTFRTKVTPCHACRNAAQNNAKLKMGLVG